MFSLEGKVCIVTGASYGLGVTFADALAEAGADIVGAARSVDKMEQTRAMVEARGRKFLTVQCDVTEYEQVANLMKVTHETFGRIDILVNNAGMSDARALRSENSEPEWFERMLKTDLIGLWYCCHAAAQYMLRQGNGNIINISSIFGISGFEGRTPGYFASKGGVNQLTRLLAVEWADRGVRVNALAPHFFDSEMTHELLMAGGFIPQWSARTPMGRIGQPEDLRGPIVFLASPASQFVNGVVLALDGGLTAAGGYTPGPFAWDEWDADGRGRPLMPGTPFPAT
jgi:NAD(P)-dependent dehydrogenase (short-subunit alcohol dehydrogenase family)